MRWLISFISTPGVYLTRESLMITLINYDLPVYRGYISSLSLSFHHFGALIAYDRSGELRNLAAGLRKGDKVRWIVIWSNTQITTSSYSSEHFLWASLVPPRYINLLLLLLHVYPSFHPVRWQKGTKIARLQQLSKCLLDFKRRLRYSSINCFDTKQGT